MLDLQAPHRILIVLLGALGDVTRGLPLAMRLRETLPNSRITWAVEPKSAHLLLDHPAIDRIVVFPRERGLRGYIEFIRSLRIEEYDVVLDLQRHLKSGVTSYLSRAPRRIGFHRKNAKEFNWLFQTETIEPFPHYAQKLDHYLKFADHLRLPERSVNFGIVLDERIRQQAEEILGSRLSSHPRHKGSLARPRVVLVVGSTWKTKFWTVEGFVGVARELSARGYLPIVVGGPSEMEFVAQMRAAAPEEPFVDLVSQTDLKTLLAVIDRSEFVVSTDSGPMHLAAALGKRVISVWGPTSPLRSEPYGSRDLVLVSPVGCSPCYRRACPGLNCVCMSEIAPAAVIAQAARVVQGSVSGPSKAELHNGPR